MELHEIDVLFKDIMSNFHLLIEKSQTNVEEFWLLTFIDTPTINKHRFSFLDIFYFTIQRDSAI